MCKSLPAPAVQVFAVDWGGVNVCSLMMLDVKWIILFEDPLKRNDLTWFTSQI